MTRRARFPAALRIAFAASFTQFSSGCEGPQSALSGLGHASQQIATLFWVMLWGSIGIVAIVIGAALIALASNGKTRRLLGQERTIIAAGVAFPVVTLSALLIYGFGLLARETSRPVGDDVVRIAVIGEQWWWRIRYLERDGSQTETANEIRIPVGRPVLLELTTADVIHSFWAPPLAGKVDMIPGHVNTLNLTATEPALIRGQCAEYCGGPHALMGFYVVAESAESFATWLERQRAGAENADSAGNELFVASGCGGCHSIRGTAATGLIGPDLTHVGTRLSIGAGVLRTSPANFASWIRFHETLKPDNRMPPFGSLSDGDYERLADYLASLD